MSDPSDLSRELREILPADTAEAWVLLRPALPSSAGREVIETHWASRQTSLMRALNEIAPAE